MADAAYQRAKNRWEREDELAQAVEAARRRLLAASEDERDRLRDELAAALRRLTAELFDADAGRR